MKCLKYLLLGILTAAAPASLHAQALAVPIANAATTGTAVNSLVKLENVSGAIYAVSIATTDTGGAIGVCSSGCGTSGTASVITWGIATCAFDGTATADDWVQISSTTAGDCHDTGSSTSPTSGQLLGRVVAGGSGAGNYTFLINKDIYPATAAQVNQTGHNVTAPLVCADASGSGTAQSCTTSPSFTPATNDCVIYTTTTTNSGTGLTSNINSLGAKSAAIPGSSGWTTTLTASIIPANTPLLACYNGTNWNVQQTGTVSSSGGGSPGGSSGNFQDNSGGTFGGIGVMNFDGTNVADTAPSTSLGDVYVAATGPTTQATLTSTITTSTTTIPFSTTGYPAPTTAAPIVIWLSNTSHNNEALICTASTSSNMTCSRAAAGTTAEAWTSSPATTVSLCSLCVLGKSGTAFPIAIMWNGPTLIGETFNFANLGNLFGVPGLYTVDNAPVFGNINFYNSSANISVLGNNSGNNYGLGFNGHGFIDGAGIYAGANGTLAVTAATATIAPVAETTVLTGTVPTSGTLTTMTVPAGSCTVGTGFSCAITIINTTSGSLTTGSGTAAGNFAAAYTLPVNTPMTCRAYGTTALWYCK